MVKFLEGKTIKEKGFIELSEKLEKIDRKLGLAVIQIGDDFSSAIYIKQKKKMCLELGYEFRDIKLDSNITNGEVVEIIKKLNEDDRIDGILLQLPISRHLDLDLIRNSIDPNKDVDCLTDINLKKMVDGNGVMFPCTAIGIIELLEYYKIEISGSNVVVIGRGNLVGKPSSILLKRMNAIVSICHSKTKNIDDYIRRADIIIVGVGCANSIDLSYAKDNCVVIDTGVNRLDDGSICGDVIIDSCSDSVSITPVINGIGPMTILELAKNIYLAYLENNKYN